jgi:uncharacterized cupin superfamily protein
VRSRVIDPAAAEMYDYPVAPERITPDTDVTANVLWEREDGRELGAVWQMSPGVLGGVETEETFFVVSGRATLTFPDGREEQIGPGSVGVFYDGDVIRWTVHETLRKVIVARPDPR